MRKKHTVQDQQVYRSIPQARFLNLTMLKGLKKYEKKEQGNTKQEEPRSNSHKATQNKNKTNRLNIEAQLIGLT